MEYSLEKYLSEMIIFSTHLVDVVRSNLSNEIRLAKTWDRLHFLGQDSMCRLSLSPPSFLSPWWRSNSTIILLRRSSSATTTTAVDDGALLSSVPSGWASLPSPSYSSRASKSEGWN